MLRPSFLLTEVLSEHTSGSSPNKTPSNPPGYPKNVDPARSYNVKFKMRKEHAQTWSSPDRAFQSKFPSTMGASQYHRNLSREKEKSMIRLLNILPGSKHDAIHCEL